MLYKSAYADLQVLVRSGSVMYHPATGVEIGRVSALTANFGNHGGEFTSTNPLTGELEQHAIIHGHFFDSKAAQERLGWTDEERESVEKTLDDLAIRQPFLLQKIEIEVPPVPAPWPTYDKHTAKDAVTFAVDLGLVHEALLYERENQNRETVIGPLEKWVENNPLQVPEPTKAVSVEEKLDIQKTGITL